MVTVTVHRDAHSFLERAESWLRAAEDRHNLILSLSYGCRERGDAALFVTVESGGDVVGCAIRTPPHKLLITEIPDAAIAPLVECIVTESPDASAVLGPEASAMAFAEAWVARVGGAFVLGMENGVYRADSVVAPVGVAGSLRPAVEDDAAWAPAWGEGFGDDTGMRLQDVDASVRHWTESGSLYVWEDGGPRCMAVAHGRTPVGVRIGFVYTPPEWRGHGYASACVAELTQRALDGGCAFCVLYTDMANPTSNRVYQRIGYELIDRAQDVLFVPETAG